MPWKCTCNAVSAVWQQTIKERHGAFLHQNDDIYKVQHRRQLWEILEYFILPTVLFHTFSCTSHFPMYHIQVVSHNHFKTVVSEYMTLWHHHNNFDLSGMFLQCTILVMPTPISYDCILYVTYIIYKCWQRKRGPFGKSTYLIHVMAFITEYFLPKAIVECDHTYTAFHYSIVHVSCQ